MSEWPGTCGVSQCIIQKDEKTKAIVLIQNDSKVYSHGGGFTNVTAYWTPVMFPLTGSYDGWGKIVDIDVDEDDNPHFMLEFFNSALKEKTLLIDNEDREEYCPANVFGDIAELVYAIERGVLKIKSIYTGKPMEITLMLVKNDVYLKSLEFMKKGIDQWKDPYKRIEDIQNGKYVDGSGQRVEDYIAEATKKPARIVCRFINYLWSVDGHHHFSESIKYNPSKSTEKLAKEAIVFRMFLDAIRKSYAPQLACGDDFYSYDTFLNWHTEVKKIVQVNKKEIDRKYAE